MIQNYRFEARWVDLEDVESPNDDLRYQAAAKGAAVIARGEGITWARTRPTSAQPVAAGKNWTSVSSEPQ